MLIYLRSLKPRAKPELTEKMNNGFYWMRCEAHWIHLFYIHICILYIRANVRYFWSQRNEFIFLHFYFFGLLHTRKGQRPWKVLGRMSKLQGHGELWLDKGDLKKCNILFSIVLNVFIKEVYKNEFWNACRVVSI